MPSPLLTDLAATWQLNETKSTRYGIVGGQQLKPRTTDVTSSTAVTRVAGPALMGGYGAQFIAANSTNLWCASSSTLQLGGLSTTGWWVWAWFKLTSLPGSNVRYGIVAKRDEVLGREWELSLFNNSGAQYQIDAITAAGTTATKVITPDTTGWHLAEAWWDPDTDTLNSAHDGGAPTTTASATAHTSNNAEFQIGSCTHVNSPMNGAIAGPGVRKRYPTSFERAELWNGGGGHLYPYGPPTDGGSRKVRFDNTNGSATVTAGSPLPLFLPPSFDWDQVYWGNGDDLTATDSAGTDLALWPEEVDVGNRYGRVWVKAPAAVPVGSSVDVTLTSGDQAHQASANYDTLFSKRTVDGSTVALFHLDTITAGSSSSATGGYTMTLVGTPTEQTTDGGNFRVVDPPWSFATGKHVTFNGSSQYATVATLLDTPPSSGCVRLWFKLEGTPGAADILLCKASSFSGATITNGFTVGFGSAGNILEFKMIKDSVTDTATLELGNVTSFGTVWHELVASWGTELRMWLNGTLVATKAHTGAWTAGSSAAFAVGAKLVATASDHLNVSVDEIEVRNAEPTRSSVQSWFNRGGLPQPYEADRWVNSGSNPVLVATLGGEQSVIGEIRIVRLSAGNWRGFYSGGNSVASLYGVTSTDGKTLTKTGSVVMGNGVGGHSTNACRGNLFRDNDGTLYMYFSDSIPTTGGSIWYATTADSGVSWTRQAVVRAPSGDHGGYANSSVVRVGNTYYWAIEYITATNPDYRIAIFTSTSPTGPLTLLDDVTPYLTIKQRGTYSAASLRYINGMFHLFPHLSRISNLPTAIWHAVSEDCRRWDLRGGADPVIDMEHQAILSRQDQSADAFVYELPDESPPKVAMLHTINDNHGGGLIADICQATFPGTLSDLA